MGTGTWRLRGQEGLIGLIEPLGFEACALRDKSEAVEAIEELGAKDRFKIVHDTFHHALAGGGPIFADYTGIVHISGIVDPKLGLSDRLDGHQGLVDEHDRIGNIMQIAGLLTAGYTGPISFEPFAADAHELSTAEAAYARSFQFIEAQLKTLRPGL